MSVADLVRAGLLTPNERLQFRGHKDVRATVTRDGLLSFGGKSFKSPSTAASVAAGNGTSINGWMAWFSSSRDKRVSLAVLRQRLLEKR